MQQLTPFGNDAVHKLAQRYGVSEDAVRTLLNAVSAGGGTMAQFYHPELGGGGQWMQGGMTMVGDMFNSRLQGQVSGICSELSSLLSANQMFQPLPSSPSSNPGSGGNYGGGYNWWPSELGNPSSSGGQNDARYAYFPHVQRLAISRNNEVTIYNTLDHQIGGVQQQQGSGSGSLSFSSQYGTFTVESLPIVSSAGFSGTATLPSISGAMFEAESSKGSAPLQNPHGHQEILQTIERLGDLAQRGIISQEEFLAKKADLLARL